MRGLFFPLPLSVFFAKTMNSPHILADVKFWWFFKTLPRHCLLTETEHFYNFHLIRQKLTVFFWFGILFENLFKLKIVQKLENFCSGRFAGRCGVFKQSIPFHIWIYGVKPRWTITANFSPEPQKLGEGWKSPNPYLQNLTGQYLQG